MLAAAHGVDAADRRSRASRCSGSCSAARAPAASAAGMSSAAFGIAPDRDRGAHRGGAREPRPRVAAGGGAARARPPRHRGIDRDRRDRGRRGPHRPDHARRPAQPRLGVPAPAGPSGAHPAAGRRGAAGDAVPAPRDRRARRLPRRAGPRTARPALLLTDPAAPPDPRMRIGAAAAAQAAFPAAGAASAVAWLRADPLSLLLGLVAVVLTARSRPLAPVTLLAALVAIVAFWPDGQDPVGPDRAAAAGLHAGGRRRGRPRRGRARGSAVRGQRDRLRLADGLVALLVVAVIVWVGALPALQPGARQPLTRAEGWVRRSVPPGQVVLVDLATWPDLATGTRARVGWFARRRARRPRPARRRGRAPTTSSRPVPSFAASTGASRARARPVAARGPVRHGLGRGGGAGRPQRTGARPVRDAAHACGAARRRRPQAHRRRARPEPAPHRRRPRPRAAAGRRGGQPHRHRPRPAARRAHRHDRRIPALPGDTVPSAGRP